jgi:hypothetical protein
MATSSNELVSNYYQQISARLAITMIYYNQDLATGGFVIAYMFCELVLNHLATGGLKDRNGLSEEK